MPSNGGLHTHAHHTLAALSQGALPYARRVHELLLSVDIRPDAFTFARLRQARRLLLQSLLSNPYLDGARLADLMGAYAQLAEDSHADAGAVVRARPRFGLLSVCLIGAHRVAAAGQEAPRE
jgi:hypothetical protein